MANEDVFSISYSSVRAAGPPARPLEFPMPTVSDGFRSTIKAYDPRSGKVHVVNNVLMAGPDAERGYLIRRKIAKSVYGVVRLCVVMNRRRARDGRQSNEDVLWESTDHLVVVKVSSWTRMRQFGGRHLENPIQEISAMQLIGNYHPNVLGAIDVMQDENYLYTIMQYCPGGDLFGLITSEKNHSMDEQKARVWFRQILEGLLHFQLKGVCHRDLSLENIMMDDEGNLVIIDMGMSLRVPYTDPSNIGCVTDVSEGTERRLILSQGQVGKLMYMAPEVVERDDVFDGFAIDLWAAGVILFVLLVGMAPFKLANESDTRYAKIAKGELQELLVGHGITLSADACDLLQNMFWHDPRQRLSLSQVLHHPWVQGRQATPAHSISKPTMVQSHHRYGATVA